VEGTRVAVGIRRGVGIVEPGVRRRMADDEARRRGRDDADTAIARGVGS
jgi:hypothetical protein